MLGVEEKVVEEGVGHLGRQRVGGTQLAVDLQDGVLGVAGPVQQKRIAEGRTALHRLDVQGRAAAAEVIIIHRGQVIVYE